MSNNQHITKIQVRHVLHNFCRRGKLFYEKVNACRDRTGHGAQKSTPHARQGLLEDDSDTWHWN